MECELILESYLNWIKDNTLIKKIGNGEICEITSPLLDRHNDSLQIYVIKKGDTFVLTDDGYTISDLKMSGLELNTPKRMDALNTILNGFGAKIDSNLAISIDADMTNMGQKKHNLLQALLAINDMYVLSQESIVSFFKEDLELFFKSSDIYFTKDIKLTGKSGYDHNFDFVISASRERPERLIRVISHPRKDSIMSAIFAYQDILSVRDMRTNHYVVYNDTDKNISADSLSALNNYNILHIPWSEKKKLVSEFSLN